MDELKNNLRKTREFLEEIIDIDFGLIDKLHSKGVLSVRESEDISANITFIRRNSMLLDIILKKKKISEFCDALTDTGQQHIVNYLNARGELSTQFYEDWPLTDREISIMERNHEVLVDIIDNSELISGLYLKRVINRRHREFISSMPTSYERNRALLRILRRCSQRSYRQTINCLRESNQGHIADILQTGGVIVPVHATLETDNLDEAETHIADEFTSLLMQRSVSAEQANRVLSTVQLNILAVKRAQ